MKGIKRRDLIRKIHNNTWIQSNLSKHTLRKLDKYIVANFDEVIILKKLEEHIDSLIKIITKNPLKHRLYTSIVTRMLQQQYNSKKK